jgi:hypothetical protein
MNGEVWGACARNSIERDMGMDRRCRFGTCLQN